MQNPMNRQIDELRRIEKRALRWCRGIHPLGFGRSARVAELYDHLMCEVEELTAQGMCEEQALLLAIAQLGESGALEAEFAKLRGVQRWSVVGLALATGNSVTLGRTLNGNERLALGVLVPIALLWSTALAPSWISHSGLALSAIASLLALQFMAFKALLSFKEMTTCQVSERELGR